MAINVPGDFLIFVAFVANILFGIMYFLVARGKVTFVSLAKKSYHVFTIAAALATAYLFYLFFYVFVRSFVLAPSS